MHSRPVTGLTSRNSQDERTQGNQDLLDIDRSEDEGMSKAKVSSIPNAVIRPEKPLQLLKHESACTPVADRRVKVQKRGRVFQVTIAGKFHGDYLKERHAISAAEIELEQSND